jgi:hypothetical protein
VTETRWRHCRRCRTYRLCAGPGCERCGQTLLDAEVAPNRRPRIVGEDEPIFSREERAEFLKCP